MINRSTSYIITTLLIYAFAISSVQASGKKNKATDGTVDKRTIVIKAHETALEHDKNGKTKKAIVDLEKIIETAKTCGDEELLEKTYEYLILFNQKSGSPKKVEEYKYLLNLIHTAAEKAQLENKNRENEIEMDRLKDKNLHAELEKQQTASELDKQTEMLLKTKDSLGILDLINKERQATIGLLTKEKEIENLKVQEQEARLKNQELVIKEKDARERFITFVVIALVVGLVILTTLAFFIYKNFKQKKKYSEKIESQLEVIQHQHQNITNSINYARKIQNAMLPQEHSLQNFFQDSFILLKPKDIVSGDFYWFFNVSTGDTLTEFASSSDDNSQNRNRENDKIIIVAADCTGHGVPGALMSMIGYNLLSMIVHKKIYEPDLLLAELHKGVRVALQQYKNDNQDGMDLALCTIDKKNKVIEYAGAKNPLVVIKNGELFHLKGDKHPIGGSQGEVNRSYTKHSISLDSETYLYMFSDGYEDQFGGPENKKFMVKNLKDLLLKIHHEPFNKQKEILDKTIEEWKGPKEKQIDDILVMGIKVA